jgi:hypothetical protein
MKCYTEYECLLYFQNPILTTGKKGKIFPVHNMQAERRSRNIA